jgi:hypothetical protein
MGRMNPEGQEEGDYRKQKNYFAAVQKINM